MIKIRDFEGKVMEALQKVKSNRAPGVDGLVSERFLLEPNPTAKYINQIWAKADQLAYVPSCMTSVFVVPIYNKGDPEIPSNYRPITLLSHIRKVISTAVNGILQSSYEYHINQYGFSKLCGTELPTIRAHRLIIHDHRYVEVLDPKQTYPSVRRDILLDR